MKPRRIRELLLKLINSSSNLLNTVRGKDTYDRTWFLIGGGGRHRSYEEVLTEALEQVSTDLTECGIIHVDSQYRQSADEELYGWLICPAVGKESMELLLDELRSRHGKSGDMQKDYNEFYALMLAYLEGDELASQVGLDWLMEYCHMNEHAAHEILNEWSKLFTDEGARSREIQRLKIWL